MNTHKSLPIGNYWTNKLATAIFTGCLIFGIGCGEQTGRSKDLTDGPFKPDSETSKLAGRFELIEYQDGDSRSIIHDRKIEIKGNKLRLLFEVTLSNSQDLKFRLLAQYVDYVFESAYEGIRDEQNFQLTSYFTEKRRFESTLEQLFLGKFKVKVNQNGSVKSFVATSVESHKSFTAQEVGPSTFSEVEKLIGQVTSMGRMVLLPAEQRGEDPLTQIHDPICEVTFGDHSEKSSAFKVHTSANGMFGGLLVVKGLKRQDLLEARSFKGPLTDFFPQQYFVNKKAEPLHVDQAKCEVSLSVLDEQGRISVQTKCKNLIDSLRNSYNALSENFCYVISSKKRSENQ